VTLNDELKNEVIDRGVQEDKITVIQNGISMDEFLPNDNNKIKMLNKLGLADSDGVIGYIGSCIDGEGVETLVSAISSINAAGSMALKLVIVEETTNTSMEPNGIDELAKRYGLDNNFIHIKGSFSNNTLSMYYDLFDIIVYPRNSLNNVDKNQMNLMRAMCKKKAIVCSNTYANKYNNILTDNHNCVIYNIDDINGCSSMITTLLTNTDLKKTIAENSYNYIESSVNWLVIGQQMRVLYNRLLSN
jgi:glycosyltransferase involved in cell wall biosynthesis